MVRLPPVLERAASCAWQVLQMCPLALRRRPAAQHLD